MDPVRAPGVDVSGTNAEKVDIVVIVIIRSVRGKNVAGGDPGIFFFYFFQILIADGTDDNLLFHSGLFDQLQCPVCQGIAFRAGFELNVHADPAAADFQSLFQGGDFYILEFFGKPGAEIHGKKFLIGEVMKFSRVIGSPFDTAVMEQHQDAVLRFLDVHFYKIRAAGDGGFDGGQSVFRRPGRISSVGRDLDVRLMGE